MVILTLVINLLNQLNWKHIKKPIMTKPYNSTIMGMKNQIVSTLNLIINFIMKSPEWWNANARQ